MGDKRRKESLGQNLKRELEDLKKILDYKPSGDHEYTYVGEKVIKNPNKDKVSAYTDKDGFRLDMFRDIDRERRRGR